MTIKLKRIAELKQLTGVSLIAVQFEMSELKSKESALRENLAALTTQKALQAQAARSSDDPALIAGADIRWHHWVDQRRVRINAELAQVTALLHNCRRRLELIFGRDQAVAHLAELAVKQDKLRRKRAADYIS